MGSKSMFAVPSEHSSDDDEVIAFIMKQRPSTTDKTYGQHQQAFVDWSKKQDKAKVESLVAKYLVERSSQVSLSTINTTISAINNLFSLSLPDLFSKPILKATLDAVRKAASKNERTGKEYDGLYDGSSICV